VEEWPARLLPLFVGQSNGPHRIHTLSELKALLSRAGLAIVPLADVPSAEDARLLQVIDGAPEDLVRAWQAPHGIIGWYNELGRAVLARRAVKAAKP
jgi:hypothetical protein